MMKQAKKEFLFNDINTYNTFLKKEEKVFEIYNELKELSIKALGDTPIDWELYLNDPSNYLIDMYWITFQPAPKHLEVNKASIFSSHTNIDINHLNKLSQIFRQAIKDCDRYAPKVLKSGLKSTLNKKQFERFLDPNKAKKYHALVKFVKAAEEISGMENTQNINLVRFCSGLLFEGLDIKINYYNFAL